MPDIRKLTLLHSNDMHGDFLAEELDETLVGGVSMLSGYVNQVRNEEKNVIYCIAGDMFRGSIIDSEFKGVSTVDIMNMLNPDVVGLGNHEFDYGAAHLLFLEKCTTFPIVNANIHINTTGHRLFNSHVVLEVGGMKILFIGIVTEEIMTESKKDMLLGTFIDVKDATEEIGIIVNSYRTEDIDLTVLLTHIGFEEDKLLAQKMDPEWGIDIIVGGHSHTFPEQPELINDILIVQAGTGTDVIGRFDIDINCDTNSVASYSWKLVPIDSDHCRRDEDMERIIYSYKKTTDDKYGRIMTRLKRKLTHPRREEETELGNLFADALYECLGTDMVLIGSGSVRKPELGPVITVMDMMEIYPYDGKMYGVKLWGRKLIDAIKYICRDEMYNGSHTETFQYSRGVKITYNYLTKELEEFSINGMPVEENKEYTIALQSFVYNNLKLCFGLEEDEVIGYDKSKVLATSELDVLYEYMENHTRLDARVEGRFTVLNRPD